MNHFKNVLKNPSAYFKEPQDVLADKDLTKEEKLHVLKQWEYDARELMVAEEESMIGDSSSPMLSRILKAIRELDPTYDATKSSGTKHGGVSSN